MSNYKRHAQGQRFRKKDFGDMGLRAYKDQQKHIIDSLKLQAAQTEKYDKEYISSEIDRGRKQAERDAKLKNLEDEVYDNKRKASDIKHARELDALEGKAREKEKEADFWADFSTTYSKQYTKAASDIYGAIDLVRAKGAIKENIESGLYDQSIETSVLFNKANESDFNNLSDGIDSDKTTSDHFKRTQLAHGLDIKRRKSVAYNDLMSKRLIDDWDRIETHAYRILTEQGREITKDNVQDILEGRALEIMANLRMNPNSRGGKKFLNFVFKKAKAEETDKFKLHWGIEDEKNLSKLTETASAYKGPDTFIEYETNLNDLTRLFKRRYVVKDGKGALETLDTKQAIIAASEHLIDKDILTTDEDIEKYILNVAHPGQPIPAKVLIDPSKDTRKTYGERHSDLEGVLKLSLSERIKEKTKAETEVKEAEDIAALNTVQSNVNSGKIDLNNIDHLIELENIYKNNEKTIEYIRNAKLFNPTHNQTSGFLVNQNLNDAYNNNDYLNWKDTMQYLGTAQRKDYEKLTKQLDELNRNGGSSKEINKLFESFVKSDLKLNALNDAEDDSVESVIDTMEQDFYFEYRKIAEDPVNATTKIDLAINKVKEKYKSGEGLYRKEDSGPNTVFPAMIGHADPKTEMSREELTQLINKNTWNTLFKDAKEKGKNFLQQDWVDRNLRNTIYGFDVEQNDTIDHLYYTQPVVSEGMLSKTDILNKILKDKGVQTVIPPGPLDKADHLAKNNRYINISNYYKMSDNNKMRMMVYLELLNLYGGVIPYKQDAYKVEADGIRMNFKLEPQYNKEELQ